MKRLSLALYSLLAMLTLGCSDANLGIISGTVTVDGQPAKTGWIGFTPLDGKQGPQGGEILDGAYTATVPTGPSRVEIRVPKIVGQTKIYNTKDSPIQDVMQESLPPKYNERSELTYDVPSGKSEKNFDLSTKTKSK